MSLTGCKGRLIVMGNNVVPQIVGVYEVTELTMNLPTVGGGNNDR